MAGFFVASLLTGRERGFRQKVDPLAQDSIHNSVDVHRLANPQARLVIARLLVNVEKDAKAIDVCIVVHSVLLAGGMTLTVFLKSVVGCHLLSM